MDKVLAIFINNSEISVYKSETPNIYSNVKIRGEVLYPFADVKQGLEFLSKYLINSIGLVSYANYAIIVLSDEVLGFDRKIFSSLFNAKCIHYLSINTLTRYSKELNLLDHGKIAALENENIKLTAQVKGERAKVKGEKAKVRDLSKSIRSSELLIKKLERQSQKYESYSLDAKGYKRDLVFLSEMKFVVSEDKIGLAKNYLKEIRQLATSGKKVAQGTVIAQYLFAKKRYASLRASSAGYVYWLTFEKSTTTSIENYKYISRSNDIALAVISSSSKENVDDIVKFVEKTCKQPIRL